MDGECILKQHRNNNRKKIGLNVYDLAGCFDRVEIYLYKLKLNPVQETDVKDLSYHSKM